jgi:hypothetical protein
MCCTEQQNKQVEDKAVWYQVTSHSCEQGMHETLALKKWEYKIKY